MSVVTAMGKQHVEQNVRNADRVCALLRMGAQPTEAEVNRAFCAYADAGEWNREHPHDQIPSTA